MKLARSLRIVTGAFAAGLAGAVLACAPQWAAAQSGFPSPPPVAGGQPPVNYPAPPVRPPTWPGGAPPAPQAPPPGTTPAGTPPPNTVAWPPRTPVQQPLPFDARLRTGPVQIFQFDSATILATVGPTVVLAGDVLPYVNEVLSQNAERIPADRVDEFRERLIQKRLQEIIEYKILYADAQRTIPADRFPLIEEKVAEQFEQTQVPRLLEKLKVASRQELDAKFRQMGSSLSRQRRIFCEQVIAGQWMRENVKFNREISHDDLLNYYREHIAEFEYPAKAQWKQLTVRFGPQRPEAEAYARIAWMGNQVLAGAKFEDVARQFSEGTTASDGGLRDWTTPNSLVSKALDHAVFHQPVGRMGPILRDDDAFHIVLVTERIDAGRTPFTEAQPEIRKKIREAGLKQEEEKFLSRLREQVQVATIFDDPAAAERFLAQLRDADAAMR